jgi:hypothetical protein
MRYIVDIISRHVQGIQKYLDKGIYNSMSQFISAAIENQLALEENELTELIPNQSAQEVSKFPSDIVPSEKGVLEKYSLKNIPHFNTTVEPPEYENLVFSSKNFSEEHAWLWGQINKIFAVKLGLRILHQLLATNQTVELNEFLETAANEAASIGDKIREYEKNNDKMRDEKISAALPTTDEKSLNRFKFQFMVYIRKDNLLDGAMALMRFCNVDKTKKKHSIGITKAGLTFSSISNPVLDGGNLDVSLSEEESLFYIKHIKQNIKGEYQAINWLLHQIDGGKNEREALNEEIKKNFGATWDATDAVINTQRAGLTARMHELGLIEKEKDGIRVKYGVSKAGKKLFFK